MDLSRQRARGSVYTGQGSAPRSIRGRTHDRLEHPADRGRDPPSSRALDFVRDYATKKKLPNQRRHREEDLPHPPSGGGGHQDSPKYRKDIPQHRLYFHEYAPPDKIAHKVRQILEWTVDPRRSARAARSASRHARTTTSSAFPFATDGGKVARLLMNLIPASPRLPPAIVHSTGGSAIPRGAQRVRARR